MTSRRNVIIGLGGLVAGGGALIGTGAFTAVEAQRSVTVETAGDADAFLGLEPAANEDYVQINEDGLLEIDISGLNGRAVTTFDPLFTMINNGTQTVQPWMDIEVDEVSGDVEPEDIEDSIIFYAKDVMLTGIGPTDRMESTGQGNSPGRGGVTYHHDPGDEVEWGLEIDFTDEHGPEITDGDIDSEDIELTATIGAETL